MRELPRNVKIPKWQYVVVVPHTSNHTLNGNASAQSSVTVPLYKIIPATQAVRAVEGRRNLAAVERPAATVTRWFGGRAVEHHECKTEF